VKNKRARFVEISKLYPDTEYEIYTSFVYDEKTLKEHVEHGGVLDPDHDGEGERIGPLVVTTASALLQCGSCGSTLNWGLEECSFCQGSDVGLHAWNK
jgi:hypothetical protein